MVKKHGNRKNDNQINTLEVIGLGALNMDYLYRVERILVDGETVVEEAKSSPGGSAANTIYGLAKLGVKTGFAGVVGDDADGKLLIQDLEKVGVDTSQIKIKRGAKTGSVLALSDRQGKRSLYVVPGANNLLTEDELEPSYINRSKILHVSSFVGEEQFKGTLSLVDRINPSVKLSFSPGAFYASKGMKVLATILSRTHILFINQNEIRQLTGEDFIAGARTCINQGCQIVAVTLGKGISLGETAAAYIRDAKREYMIEPRRQAAVFEIETTGAGDAFAAGFLYGLLNEKGLEECGRLGDIVAQFSISKVGARAGLPTLKKLAQRYQELYNKQM